MGHTQGRPYHSQTQGKIERWHRSMKNQSLMGNYYLSGELGNRIRKFVDYYNHERYHESLHNFTPADVYYGCGQAILDRRGKIKLRTLARRRKMHYDNRTQSRFGELLHQPFAQCVDSVDRFSCASCVN